MDLIAYINKQLGVSFTNTQLLETAFTHTSYANEKGKGKIENNERLEFLGDAVVELIVSQYLFDNFLQWPEGKLTRLRSQLVCEQSLSTFAKDCGFDRYVKLGKGEELNGGRSRNALLCDLFEAFVGALYLDKGLEVTRLFVISCIQPMIDADTTNNLFVDYKTKLQEYVQKNGAVKITYTVVKESGQSHDKLFEVNVSVNDKVVGNGSGKSKRAAQQQAAKEALEQGDLTHVFGQN